MELPNISNPEAVQALLEQLRSSAAWQSITASTTETSPMSEHAVSDSRGEQSVRSSPHFEPASDGELHAASSATTVAALLSQLQASSQLPVPDALQHVDNSALVQQHDAPLHFGPSHPSSSSRSSTPYISDMRSATFQQALPYIARLSQDHHVVEVLRNMRQEQKRLESRLWEERQAIQRSHEDKVQVVRTKANLTGAGLTEFEANSMMDNFRRELQKFDSDRVLPAWDGLLVKHQAALESLGVPAMFPTMTADDIQRQQKVLRVLEGALE